MKELEKKNPVSLYAIGAIIAYIVLNQGGYFAGAVISVGLIVTLLLFRVKIRFKTVDLLFLAFSVWYFFCSVRTGFDVRYIAKGILPLLCLMFKFLLPEDKKESEELLKKIIKISFYITIISIIVCVNISLKSMRLRRLTFPFQYANASGIFFGVMFILSRYLDFEWAKKREYVFFLGLVLTQSVGAIGLTVLAELFLSKNKKRTIFLIALLLVGAAVLRGRIYQSVGTFIERFLQMYDGVLCMGDNPLFGIGAGRWELVKNLYQTGFYDAREIHSGIVGIGVDSGFLGIILFGITLIFAFASIRFSKRPYLAGILMIIFHSCLDFSLAFTALCFILVILFNCGECKEERTIEFKTIAKSVTLTVMAVGFLTLSVGMYQIKKLDGIDYTKRYPYYINYYESHFLSQKSVKTRENYAKALYATGNKEKCLEVLENIDVLSSDMIILKKGCYDDWREVIKELKIQPYNSVLYKTVFYNSNDEALQKQSEEMLNEAIDSMSFLGKILFNFKGEKIL